MFFAYFIAKEVEDISILPLHPLHTDLVHQQPGYPDIEVGFPYQGDGHPTLYLAASAGVGLLSICRKAAGYTIVKLSLCLYAKEAMHQYSKGSEVSALLGKKSR